MSACLTASPCPRILTHCRGREAATSGLTTTTAPPLSVTTQQSIRCSGELIIGESSTSSTVTGVGRKACGLCWACSDAATLTSASWALVVPYWCMCRVAAIAYPVTAPDMPHRPSKTASGTGSPGRPPIAAERGRPAIVISATEHLPAAMASAACPTCTTYDDPTVSVL